MRNIDVRPIASNKNKPDPMEDLKAEWGVFTTNAIRKGENIIQLPYKLTIGITSVDLQLLPPALSDLVALVPKEWNELALGLRLLVERCGLYEQKSYVISCSWILFSLLPYIGALPLYFPGIPIFYPPYTLESFCYSPLTVLLFLNLFFLIVVRNS